MFKWLLIAALLISIAVCAVYEFNGRRKIEAIEKETAEARAELKPLANIAAEVQSYQVQKDALQERIDLINQQKQNQHGASDAVAMLSAVEGDPSIDSIAVIDHANVVINGHDEAAADRIAAKFPRATKRVAPDHSYVVQVTR